MIIGIPSRSVSTGDDSLVVAFQIWDPRVDIPLRIGDRFARRVIGRQGRRLSGRCVSKETSTLRARRFRRPGPLSRIDLIECGSDIFRYLASARASPRRLSSSVAALSPSARAASSADGSATALDGSGFRIERCWTRLDRLEGAMCGLIGVGVPLVVQLETDTERLSHGWCWWLGESDTVQRCAGGGDLGGGLFVMSDQLRRALLDVGGVHLCLGRSRQIGPWRHYRKVFAHKVSGAAGVLDRIQHAALGRIERLRSPARYRSGFVQNIGQPPHLDQIGERPFLCRLGGGTLPHRPTRRHRRPMNRRERGLPNLGGRRPVRRRTF